MTLCALQHGRYTSLYMYRAAEHRQRIAATQTERTGVYRMEIGEGDMQRERHIMNRGNELIPRTEQTTDCGAPRHRLPTYRSASQSRHGPEQALYTTVYTQQQQQPLANRPTDASSVKVKGRLGRTDIDEMMKRKNNNNTESPTPMNIHVCL